MANQLEIETMVPSFKQLCTDIERYFDKAEASLKGIEREDKWLPYEREFDFYWNELPAELRQESEDIVARLIKTFGTIGRLLRKALLVSEADQQDIVVATKTMRAAILLRKYTYWTTEIINDEDRLLGVTPPGQSENKPVPPEIARRYFAEWKNKTISILELVNVSSDLDQPQGTEALSSVRYRPNTAFIMMWMDNNIPELIDIADAVKQVFGQFGIRAVKADDIEHDGIITTRIINEIKTSEFCFADLTGERPNVYYEVGYAHAIGRSVILYRKKGTGLHFDLAGYNCPEYENIRDLKQKLVHRLGQITNRKPKEDIAT